MQLKRIKFTEQDKVDIIGHIVTDFKKIPSDVRLRLLLPFDTNTLEFAISSYTLTTTLREEIGGVTLHKLWKR